GAHIPGPGAGGKRLPEGDGDRIEEVLGPLPEELAVLEAEDRAPDLVEMDRDHRDVQALDDLFEAALEREKVAGAADRALGEDADYVAALELRARAADRLDGAAAAGGRDGVHLAEQPAEARQLEERRIDHEAHEALDRGADQQPIDEGKMVAHQQ